MPKINISGEVFGKLTVVAEYKHGWMCVCVCGKEVFRTGSDLRAGRRHHCGCERPKHGYTTHSGVKIPEYHVWLNMRVRCNNPKNPMWKHYGGRGITVCERWNRFENFLEDMGRRPTPDHSIERVNNNLGYSPDNCEWRTNHDQSRNKRNNVLITANGETKTMMDWSISTGIPFGTLSSRKQRLGWSDDATINTPSRKRSK